MKGSSLFRVAGFLSFLCFVALFSAGAQTPPPHHMSGLINDYVPSTVAGGPWEMHGQWTLDLNERSGTADFSADMTMSGYGKTSTGAPDPTQGGAGAHTHHIKITNARIAWDISGCPTFSPATQGGFQFTKAVSLMTGNGGNAPFESDPPSSVLQVCVSGGDGDASVAYSNITLVFETGSPAIKHFGSQAIHGVIRKSDFLPTPGHFGLGR